MSGRSGNRLDAGQGSADPDPTAPDSPLGIPRAEAAALEAAAVEAAALAAPGRSPLRGRVFLALRIVASVTMLGLLLTRFDLSVLNPIHELSSWTWVVAGVLVTFGAVVLATLRWQRVLQALDLPSDLHTLLNHVLAGVFVSNFLPSTVGGDVLRVARLSAGNGHRQESFASVVLERLTGFVVLPFITLVALVGNPTLLHLGTATHLALGLSLGTLAVLVVIL